MEGFLSSRIVRDGGFSMWVASRKTRVFRKSRRTMSPPRSALNDTPQERHRRPSWIDVVALGLILAALLILVISGQANAAIIAAAGGFAAVVLRVWRAGR